MSGSKSVLLRGLQPQPLASYLAALGVLRICAAQHDQAILAAFERDGYRLDGIDENALVTLLLEHWAPSPVLCPWNNASGFYASSKGRLAAAAIDAVLASNQPRFACLIDAIQQVRKSVAAAGYREAPKEDEKAGFIASLRGVLSDEALLWLDAAAVVDEGDARMMPVLGSGGNEGVLDYSGLFLRSLVEVLLADRDRSESLLRAALFASSTCRLIERPGGQFDPGTAGGFNTGPGFESKDLPNNPWTFVLLIEGTLVWSSGLASRQSGLASGYRFAVSPFTVRHRAAGYGSAGSTDDDPQRVRAETWVPIWRKPARLAEVARFIAEGRVDVGGRRGTIERATDSLDFVDAIASLGIDRGVDSFVRYTFIKRRGESYIALPAGTIQVRHRREVDLVRQVDGELDVLDRFLARFPSEQGPPAQLVSRRRAIDDARFEVAARGGQDAMTRLVRAIGALEMTLARRDPGKEPRLPRPLGGLGVEWIDACGDAVEVRLASALASLTPTGGAGAMRAYLAPLDPKNPKVYAPAARARSWAGVDLAERLASVLQRRMLDVRARSTEDGARGRNPTWGTRPVALDDIAAFLHPGLVDETALEELLFGFTWVKPEWARSRRIQRVVPPVPREYALLKLHFLPDGIPQGGERIALTPDGAILSLLRAGRIGDAVRRASATLRAKGLRPRTVTDPYAVAPDAARGRRLAAALLVPTADDEALLGAALIPATDSEEHEETIDAR